jgi:hypothetical protein
MNLITYISVVGAGLVLIALGWIVIGLEKRITELKRRMEDE